MAGLSIHVADFHGRQCEVCELEIRQGQDIVKLPDEDEWVHADCAEDEGYEVQDPLSA